MSKKHDYFLDMRNSDFMIHRSSLVVGQPAGRGKSFSVAQECGFWVSTSLSK